MLLNNSERPPLVFFFFLLTELTWSANDHRCRGLMSVIQRVLRHTIISVSLPVDPPQCLPGAGLLTLPLSVCILVTRPPVCTHTRTNTLDYDYFTLQVPCTDAHKCWYNDLSCTRDPAAGGD
ncbi:hypothetical protein OJAV_G00202870 [Oryzias javanicus]|uniref:Secreted protein n=1 Tax=Oryzias javanicus TaxID=123683 RepID=A0A3S2PCI1_ORYJA|nr:hypothetical protein OJAV_G00202870 [Oryzias javanicus]